MDIQPYTMEQALEEAYGLLEGRFGKVDQEACVTLAASLYTTRVRDAFTKRHEDADEISTM